MDSSLHWSFKLPDTDSALPAGAFRCLEEAMAYLGSISSLHQEISSSEKRSCRCLACAGNLIQGLAVDYNKHRLLAGDAPRAKHVLSRASHIYEYADQLLNEIIRMDDFTREAFHRYGRNNSTMDLPFYPGYFNDGHPDPDDLTGDSPWVTNLTELREGAKLVVSAFKSSRVTDRSDVADKGGNTNLFKEGFGSADRMLVISGWQIFERFRPKEAKGGERSDFCNFLKSVFEYATGKDPEAHSTLPAWVNALAKPLREQDRCMDQYILAEAEFELFANEVGAEFERTSAQAAQIELASRELAAAKFQVNCVTLGRKTLTKSDR